MQLPNDPLFPQQWYLYNTGQGGRTPRVDLNLIDENPNTVNVWDEYSGKGVRIGIIDSEIQANHENLQSNYRPNFREAQLLPFRIPPSWMDSHGTAVAGIIAGAANGLGTRGIAYNSEITGFQFNTFFLPFGPNVTQQSLLAQASFDISNNSWGPNHPFSWNSNQESTAWMEDAVETGIISGRDGMGTVFVWAAGNERQELGHHANYNNVVNSRYTIAVAAIDGHGVSAPYSNQGSNLLVSAFGDGDSSQGRPGTIVTTDLMGPYGSNRGRFLSNRANLADLNYTSTFDGTSAAAPMVSGVVALMLEANPNLGYRDVQEILAYSARQNHVTHPDWRFNGAINWNGGGLHVNHDYGFGLVDAHAAVRLSETWTVQQMVLQPPNSSRPGTWESEASLSQSSMVPVTLVGLSDVSQTLTLPAGVELQHTEIEIDISHDSIEDLIITLTSPSGTESLLFNGPQLQQLNIGMNGQVSFSEFRDNPAAFTLSPYLLNLGRSYQQGINFTFSSTFNWGESSEGDWILTVENTQGTTLGTLNRWDLRVYGDELMANQSYIYTQEYGRLADPDRRYLENRQGQHLLNAAAIRSDSWIDLTRESTSFLAGQPLTLDEDTQIVAVFGGDGNDTIWGNRVQGTYLMNQRGDNIMVGGAGDDTLVGGSGDDTLLGGAGRDTLVGGSGDNFLMGGEGNDILFGGLGNDTLVGGEGQDVFVLRPDGGENLIQDFTVGEDIIGLSQGLTLESITWVQGGENALIQEGDQTLAILNQVDSASLSPENFSVIDWG
ncbi:MAG: S8 family serine peptidase [Phormidium sp. BM_Day4_Bin.17]|nr:S8 family serine peptidase [Phormidium sp. BM_Day4_Bin.17]UCJ11567.1 MAG: S8 family serine peptidase [Phormidium sp. PBR-2020]